MCSTIRNNEKGFTLVEIAIVIVILGILIGAAAPIYGLYLKNKAYEGTKEDITTIAAALGAFRAANGRYPCPAPLNIDRVNPAYGHEDCSAMSAISPGNCSAGFCVEQSVRTDIANRRVRVGAVPFRALALTEDQAYDGYDNRITYAVTEGLMDDATFDPDEGGIGIQNNAATPESMIDPENSAHFIVFSHGLNGAGAYTRAGVLASACPASGPESENCNVLSDQRAIYAITQRSDTAVSAEQFDDIVAYSTQENIPQWQYTPNSAYDIRDKAKENVAINLGIAPQEKLHVGGDVRSQNDIYVSNLCEYDGSDCFDTSLIGGQLLEGEGMQCPPGQFAVGISNGQLDCQSEIIVSCETGVMRGIDADGNPICEDPPCAAQSFGICSAVETIPMGSDGDWASITGGDSKVEYYHCENGNWTYDPSKDQGECICTPQDYTYTDTNCGYGMTGYRVIRHQHICPNSTDSNTIEEDYCVCVPNHQDRIVSCATGFTGQIEQSRDFTCPAASWTSWTEVSNTCTCVPNTGTRTINCSGGLTGSIQQERTFQCPSGTWTPWTEVSNTCTCVVKTEEQTLNCPAGYIGHTKEERTLQCPSATWTAWVEVENTCTEIPPVVCHWNSDGSPHGPEDFKNSINQAGKECTCGDSGQCYSKIATSSYLHYDNCTCD